MKKVLKLAIAGFILQITSATRAQEKPVGYTIEGQLTGLHDATSLYLIRNKMNQMDTLLVTQSKGDRFKFKGYMPLEGEGCFIFLDTLNPAYKHLKRRYILVHMENRPITIRGSVGDLRPYGIKIEGSETHKDLMNFSSESKRRFTDKEEVMRHELSKLIVSKDSSENTVVRRKELQEAIISLRAQHPVFKNDWLQKHLNSLIAPWILLNMNDSLQAYFYPRLTAKAQASYYGVKLKKQIDLSSTLAIGRKAPELNLMTAEDQLLSLHTVAQKHKLTIIDFWAYWCIPCRNSFPKLKELYNRYHERGLAIYGVSIDPQRKKWLEAMKEDNLPWYNVIVTEDRNAVKDLYDISAIPTCLLLDQDGRILLKWKGGESAELETILSSYL